MLLPLLILASASAQASLFDWASSSPQPSPSATQDAAASEAASPTASPAVADSTAPALAEPPAPAAVPSEFAVNGRLRKHVDFWVSIYTQYYTHHGVIHDSKYIDLVYEVVDFREGASSRRGIAKRVKAAKKKWREVLMSLHRKQKSPEAWAGLNEEEKKVAALFEGVDEPNKFLKAAHRRRMRFQLGQKDRFMEGLRQYGRYIQRMEEIFRAEGLPIELTRLPFVESSFNLKARSKVGASGIWQFMRSTGRMFVKVNEAVDERNDPIRATEAAAKLLKLNYKSLGRWPLAVTAYNHGRKGMMRAVRKVGSDDLEVLVGEHRSRGFGFASANFFAELLAAVEAERNAEKYFGKVERAPAEDAVEVRIPHYIDYRELCRFLKLDPDGVRELNPALSSAVFKGKLLVPKGYLLRIPADGTLGKDAQARVFLAGYEQIPSLFKLKAQKRDRYGRKGKPYSM